MKKNLASFLLVVCFVITTAFASTPGVPAKVLEKMSSLYPEATKIEWKTRHGFEASFVLKNRKGVSVFDKKGNVLYSHIDMSYWSLPMPVLQEVKNNYVVKGYVVNKVTHLQHKEKDTYDVEVARAKEIYTLRYYPNGKRVAIFNMANERKVHSKE